MNRRGFITSAVALAAVTKFRSFFCHTPAVPVLYGDGINDDTPALQAWGSGRPWRHSDGTPGGKTVVGKFLLITETIVVTCDSLMLVNNHINLRPRDGNLARLAA